VDFRIWLLSPAARAKASGHHPWSEERDRERQHRQQPRTASPL